MTVKEAAARLACGVDMVYDLIKGGHLAWRNGALPSSSRVIYKLSRASVEQYASGFRYSIPVQRPSKVSNKCRPYIGRIIR